MAFEGSDGGAGGGDWPGSGASSAWIDELSERVQDYRRRRRRLRHAPESNRSLEFDFGSLEPHEHEVTFSDTSAHAAASGDVAELLLARPAGSESEHRVIDKVALSALSDEAAVSEASQVKLAFSVPSQDVAEFTLESAPLASVDLTPEVVPLPVPPGPLGRRFLAGMLDTLVLMLGAALFGLIFWRAGGQLSVNPLDVAVLVLVGTIFVVAYFGLFIAIAASTPGMMWLGLEVRNLHGGLPTWRESFWRAFGYLVSAAALALGFLWALVDSQKLTWHDHVSGTLVTSVESTTARVNLLAT